MPRATLKATERIKKSNDITTLIRKGQAFFSAPYKVYYSWEDASSAVVRAAFSVPKRNFGKAVMRNKLKRLTRESFRLQKGNLEKICKAKQQRLNIVFMYQKTKVKGYKELHRAIGDALISIEKKNG